LRCRWLVRARFHARAPLLPLGVFVLLNHFTSLPRNLSVRLCHRAPAGDTRPGVWDQAGDGPEG